MTPEPMRSNAVDRFAWERALLADPAVTRMRLGVLLALATTWDKRTGRVAQTQAALAKETGHDISRIRGVIRWAQPAGYLVAIVRGHRKGNGETQRSEYRLAVPQPVRLAPAERVQPVREAPQEREPQPVPNPVSTGAESGLNRCAPHHQSKTKNKAAADVLDAATLTKLKGVADPTYPPAEILSDLRALEPPDKIYAPVRWIQKTPQALIRDKAREGFRIRHDSRGHDGVLYDDSLTPTPYDNTVDPDEPYLGRWNR